MSPRASVSTQFEGHSTDAPATVRLHLSLVDDCLRRTPCAWMFQPHVGSSTDINRPNALEFTLEP